LIRVRDRRAVVAGVSDAVAIAIDLVRVRDRRAVVAEIAVAVAVAVGLIRVRHRGAVVASVSDAVAVRIRLLRIRRRRAVVVAVDDAVAIGVRASVRGELELVELRVVEAVRLGRNAHVVGACGRVVVDLLRRTGRLGAGDLQRHPRRRVQREPKVRGIEEVEGLRRRRAGAGHRILLGGLVARPDGCDDDVQLRGARQLDAEEVDVVGCRDRIQPRIGGGCVRQRSGNEADRQRAVARHRERLDEDVRDVVRLFRVAVLRMGREDVVRLRTVEVEVDDGLHQEVGGALVARVHQADAVADLMHDHLAHEDVVVRRGGPRLVGVEHHVAAVVRKLVVGEHVARRRAGDVEPLHADANVAASNAVASGSPHGAVVDSAVD